MLVLIQIISVTTYSWSIAIVNLLKKNKYILQDFARRGFLTLLRYLCTAKTNYFGSLRMALLSLIVIIFLEIILPLLCLSISRENSECSNNSRDAWKTLNSLIRSKNTSKYVTVNHNGSSISDPSVIAEIFNNNFSKIALNLDRNIPHSNNSP